MATVSSHAATGFRGLKSPSFYFEDPRTVELLDAALAGDEKRVTQLVAQGANPNDEGPRTPNANRLRLIHYALASNNPAAVVALARAGADPELEGKNYGNAYQFAVSMNDLRALQLLLKLKPLQSLAPKTVSSLAFGALDGDNRDAVTGLLLENGMSVNVQDAAGYTLLMRSLEVPDLGLAAMLVRRGADVKIRTPRGVSAPYILERSLERMRPGSPTQQQLLALRELMVAAGAVFPTERPKSAS